MTSMNTQAMTLLNILAACNAAFFIVGFLIGWHYGRKAGKR